MSTDTSNTQDERTREEKLLSLADKDLEPATTVARRLLVNVHGYEEEELA